jgi:hypothetical protein
MRPRHPERHRTERIGWLRAAVLGANDGIVSTASLVLGVATAEANRSAVLVAGVAGLVPGAMSMAAGEALAPVWPQARRRSWLQGIFSGPSRFLHHRRARV